MKPKTKKKPVKRTKLTAYRLFRAVRSIRARVYGNLYAGGTWADLDPAGRIIYKLIAKHLNEN